MLSAFAAAFILAKKYEWNVYNKVRLKSSRYISHKKIKVRKKNNPNIDHRVKKKEHRS